MNLIITDTLEQTKIPRFYIPLDGTANSKKSKKFSRETGGITHNFLNFTVKNHQTDLQVGRPNPNAKGLRGRQGSIEEDEHIGIDERHRNQRLS